MIAFPVAIRRSIIPIMKNLSYQLFFNAHTVQSPTAPCFSAITPAASSSIRRRIPDSAPASSQGVLLARFVSAACSSILHGLFQFSDVYSSSFCSSFGLLTFRTTTGSSGFVLQFTSIGGIHSTFLCVRPFPYRYTCQCALRI